MKKTLREAILQFQNEKESFKSFFNEAIITEDRFQESLANFLEFAHEPQVKSARSTR